MTTIPITLTSEQQREARSGTVTLDAQQIRAASSALSRSQRVYAVSCECGTCSTCRRREQTRRYRANQQSNQKR